MDSHNNYYMYIGAIDDLTGNRALFKIEIFFSSYILLDEVLY